MIPKLNKNVDIVYLEGRDIISDTFDKTFLSHVLYNLKNYSNFPHLIKIRNGAIEDLSINNELFSCINQGKDKSALLNKIEHFFEFWEHE